MANDRNDYRGYQDRDSRRYGREYGSNEDYGSANGGGYRPGSGQGARDDRNFRSGGTGYGGDRGARSDSWSGREAYGSGERDYYGGSADYDRGGFGRQQHGGDRGFYGSDRDRDQGYGGNRGRYGRPPQGYDYQDRGFMARAGDEVRSWFGDEDAERRRDFDQRYDERLGHTGHGHDSDYHGWRRGQIDALDRDYHEYRQENARKFENEFGAWRTNRQTQRQSLSQVKEHMDVVGSDGSHVGTVDKVRGDRIILTKNDTDAGGRHHSIPSSWIQSVDDKVTISKSAEDAHKHWRDEEKSSAMFGGNDRSDADRERSTNLNRSFSGTY